MISSSKPRALVDYDGLETITAWGASASFACATEPMTHTWAFGNGETTTKELLYSG